MSQRQKGIVFLLLSAFFFACMNACVKWAGDLPAIQKSLFRNVIAMMVAFVLLWRSGIGFKVQKDQWANLLVRSLMGTIGLVANYYAVSTLLLADASAIQKLAPVFVILFSIVLLKEKVSLKQWLFLALSFLAALLVVQPSGQMDWPAIVALVGAACAGFAYTMVRKLQINGVKGPQIVFYFSFFSCISLLPAVLVSYQSMSGQQWFALLLAGLFASVAQFSVTAAYQHAPGREISYFDYSQVVFAGLLGLIFFGQVPNHLSILGYLLLFGVGYVSSRFS